LQIIKTDCYTLDYNNIGKIAVCILNVDLYLSIRDVLLKIYDRLIENGVILIDNCKKNNEFDRAYSACKELVKERKFLNVI
jgi:hypothetical protein